MTEVTRTIRDLETRATTERPKSWQPPSMLPEPDRQPGYDYRWVRTANGATPDARNVQAKRLEGWEPVRIEEQPKFLSLVSPNGQFKDCVTVAEMVLCKIPTEFMDQRRAHFKNMTQSQMASVDNNFMRDSDPRMPLFSEKQSKTSFGKGK